MDKDLINRLAAETALDKMFRRGWVDICAINEVGDMLGIPVRQAELYPALHLLHCVNFRDMPKALYDQLPEIFRNVLGAEVPDWAMRGSSAKPSPESKGFIARLMGN